MDEKNEVKERLKYVMKQEVKPVVDQHSYAEPVLSLIHI